MNKNIFLIVIASLILGCTKSDSGIEAEEELIFNIEEELIFNISVLNYDYCSESIESTDSFLIISSGDVEIINQELPLGLNSILLPSEYVDFNITISKNGAEGETFSLTKEEMKTYENSSLEINLETKIFEGNLIIDTNEKYETFVAGNYGRVNGSLVLANINNLTDISQLISLTSIQGGLRIINLENLENLEGLNNIKCIGGDLSIYNNALISNIESLFNLSKLGDYLWIQDNPELNNLEGLNNISSLSSYLNIFYNNSLTSLAGIDNINSIEGDIEIIGNETLTSIEALNGLTTVNQNLRISGNFELVNLTGLNNIASITQNLIISENKINSLNGLNNLISVGGNLNIYSNSFLYDWCPIQNLFLNNGLSGGHLFGNCSYNPSIQDIIDGNCSQ